MVMPPSAGYLYIDPHKTEKAVLRQHLSDIAHRLLELHQTTEYSLEVQGRKNFRITIKEIK